nr:MAG TPA: hypothetical protein [Caudoviricetes sp.]
MKGFPKWKPYLIIGESSLYYSLQFFTYLSIEREVINYDKQ